MELHSLTLFGLNANFCFSPSVSNLSGGWPKNHVEFHVTGARIHLHLNDRGLITLKHLITADHDQCYLELQTVLNQRNSCFCLCKVV